MENEEASLIDCSPEVTKRKWGRAGLMWGTLKVDWSVAKGRDARWHGLEAGASEIKQSSREKQGREVINNKTAKHIDFTNFFVKRNVKSDKLMTASPAPSNQNKKMRVGKIPWGVDTTPLSSKDSKLSSSSESPQFSSLSSSFHSSNDDFYVETYNEDLMPSSGNHEVKDASVSINKMTITHVDCCKVSHLPLPTSEPTITVSHHVMKDTENSCTYSIMNNLENSEETLKKVKQDTALSVFLPDEVNSNPRRSDRVSKPTPSLMQYRGDMKLNECNRQREVERAISDEEIRDVKDSLSPCCSERDCVPTKNILQVRKVPRKLAKTNNLLQSNKEMEEDERYVNMLQKKQTRFRKKFKHETKRCSVIIKKIGVNQNDIKPLLKGGIKGVDEVIKKNKCLSDQLIPRCSERKSKPTKCILQFRETLKRKRETTDMFPNSKMKNGQRPAEHVQEKDAYGRKALAFETKLCSVNIKKDHFSVRDIQAATNDGECKKDEREIWRDNHSQNMSAFEEELRKRFYSGEEN